MDERKRRVMTCHELFFYKFSIPFIKFSEQQQQEICMGTWNVDVSFTSKFNV